MLHSHQFTTAISPRLFIMETSSVLWPASSSVYAPLPLKCKCPLVVVESSTHMTIGRRCRILYCTEFKKDNHYSQSLLCNLTLASEPSASDITTVSDCFYSVPTPHSQSLSPYEVMPRMRCRRGSSKGRMLHSSPSTVSNSSSPSSNHFLARYLDTCSGRGRTRVVSSQPLQTCPSATALPSSSQHSSYTTHFTYQCSLDRPLIKATITVMFQEEPSIVEGRPTRVMEKNDTAQGNPSALNSDSSRAESRKSGPPHGRQE